MAKTKASQPTNQHTVPQTRRTLEKRIGHTTYEVLLSRKKLGK